MKPLYIITLAIVCLGLNYPSFGKIKNGYEDEIKKAKNYMHNLTEISKEVLSEDHRIRLNLWLQFAYAKAENIRKYQAKTQELIEKFRFIDPALYDEINTIKDREGNDTDVYVKISDDLVGSLIGSTNVSQSIEDPDVYCSEYGDHTVSVRIASKAPKGALWILVHELGHVRYQVPHLADYMAFYKKCYQDAQIIGHRPGDPSHKSVKETLKTFNTSWREYNRERKWIAQNKPRKMLAYVKEM